jgi:hypothetical protein
MNELVIGVQLEHRDQAIALRVERALQPLVPTRASIGARTATRKVASEREEKRGRMRRGGSSLDVEAARCRRLHGADGARQACAAPHLRLFGGGFCLARIGSSWRRVETASGRAATCQAVRGREEVRDE